MNRDFPTVDADEKAMLTQFLDFHRATLLWKLDGLSKPQLDKLSVSTSTLTLAGLIKHLALVEDDWFQSVFLGLDLPEPWASAPFDHDKDWDFNSAADDSMDELIALYESACRRSRAVVAEASSLDCRSARHVQATQEPYTLRWIILHMIEESARHNGHADLLREAIDGSVGE